MPPLTSTEKFTIFDNNSWTSFLENYSIQKEKEKSTEFYYYKHIAAYIDPNTREYEGLVYSTEEFNQFTKWSLTDIVNETERRKDLSLSQRIRLVKVLGKLEKMYDGVLNSYGRSKAEWLIKELKPTEREIGIIQNFQKIYRKNRIPNKWHRITHKIIDPRIDAVKKIQGTYKKYRMRTKLHQFIIDQKRKAAIKIQRCYRRYRKDKTSNQGLKHRFWTLLKKIWAFVVMLFEKLKTLSPSF